MRRVRMAARALRRSCGTPAARSRPSAAGVTSSGATSRALSSSFREIPIVDKKFVEALSERIKAAPEGSNKEVLIDVRERMEMAFGAIPGSINIPLSEFSKALEASEESWRKQYKAEPIDEDTQITLYCRSGARSDQAARVAVQAGFENVKNYKGSYIDWFGKAY